MTGDAFELDPLSDPRWRELVDRHPRASVFHTPAWLAALKRTYGYTPVALTTTGPGEPLDNGMVFCQVRSWLTGDRLVSLPFSDHCEPLVDSERDLATLSDHLRRVGRYDYVEVRPQTGAFRAASHFPVSERFWLHQLDLRRDEDVLFGSLGKDSVQRKIRRAEREGVTYEEARSEKALHAFYQLLQLTRRRHGLPPQPFVWFCNLADGFGPEMAVRLARYHGRAVAAMITLRHRHTMVYKYGASDAAFHRLGGMQLLFWKAIQEARSRGCHTLDLGRCGVADAGLATFKNRLGAEQSAIDYCRNPAAQSTSGPLRRRAVGRAKRLLPYIPDPCASMLGRLLYRHAG